MPYSSVLIVVCVDSGGMNFSTHGYLGTELQQAYLICLKVSFGVTCCNKQIIKLQESWIYYSLFMELWGRSGGWTVKISLNSPSRKFSYLSEDEILFTSVATKYKIKVNPENGSRLFIIFKRNHMIKCMTSEDGWLLQKQILLFSHWVSAEERKGKNGRLWLRNSLKRP